MSFHRFIFSHGFFGPLHSSVSTFFGSPSPCIAHSISQQYPCLHLSICLFYFTIMHPSIKLFLSSSAHLFSALHQFHLPTPKLCAVFLYFFLFLHHIFSSSPLSFTFPSLILPHVHVQTNVKSLSDGQTVFNMVCCLVRPPGYWMRVFMLAVCMASIVVIESTQCNHYLLMFFPGHYWTLFLISSCDFLHKINRDIHQLPKPRGEI